MVFHYCLISISAISGTSSRQNPPPGGPHLPLPRQVTPMSVARQNYRKWNKKLGPIPDSRDLQPRCSELPKKEKNGIHMLEIPLLYFLEGSSDQITKKIKRQGMGWQNSEPKSKQEKEPVPCIRFLCFPLDVAMHKDEGLWIEITYAGNECWQAGIIKKIIRHLGSWEIRNRSRKWKPLESHDRIFVWRAGEFLALSCLFIIYVNSHITGLWFWLIEHTLK